MKIIRILIWIILIIFPITKSFGAMVTEVDDQEFADGGSNSMSGINFNDDGTKMFLLYQGGTHGDDHNYINQYNLSTPFDISTATYAGDSARCYLDYGDDTGLGTDRIFDLEFSSDGLKLFTVYGSASNEGQADKDGIYRFDLTSPFDISTCSFANTTTDLDSADLQDGSLAGDRIGDTELKKQKGNRSQGISFNDDGTKVFISHKAVDVSGTGRILEYNLSTAYDLSTLTLNTNAGIQVGSGSNNYMTMTFGLDGKRIFIVDHNGFTVTQITIGSSFDLSSTSTTDGTVNLHTLTSSNVSQPRGIAFSTNGLKMFITVDSSKRGTEDVFEYDLTCPFNIIEGNCPEITAGDRTGLVEAQIEVAKRTIEHSTDTALNRLKWIRRNKDLQDLSYQNIKLNFSNQMLASLSEAIQVSTKEKEKDDDIFYWAEGSLAFGNVRETDTSSKKKIYTDGITFGADKFTVGDGIKGLAFRFSQNDVKVGTSGSKLDANTYNLTYYSTALVKDDSRFLDTIIGVGALKYNISSVLDGSKLIGNRNGRQIYGTLKIKEEIIKDGRTLIPSGQIDLGYTLLSSYSESGKSAMRFDKQSIQSRNLRLSLASVEELNNKKYKIKKHGKIEYQANLNRSSNAKYSYIGDSASGNFDTKFTAGALHNINGEVGVDIIYDENFSLFFIYEQNYKHRVGVTNKIHLAIGYLPQKNTNFAFKIEGDDILKAKYIYSKNVNGLDIDFYLLNNDAMRPETFDEIALNLRKVF
ncbi:autotransporter domain-containing protein [Candidatus Pelagibacter sp.]|uniref:autotransporter domain-containing protein n=1 Tax=Candidatus Pelagibacter sp. TaxID=2024849 RepID=UPI003F84FAA9